MQGYMERPTCKGIWRGLHARVYGEERGSYARGDMKGLATFMAGVSLYTIHLANLLIQLYIDSMKSSVCYGLQL